MKLREELEKIYAKAKEADPELQKLVIDSLIEKVEENTRGTPARQKEEYIAKWLVEHKIDHELREFSGRSMRLKLGEKKSANSLSQELSQYLSKVREEHPQVVESHARLISEIRGDIMAVMSDGKRGSTRKVLQFEREQKEAQQKHSKNKQ